LTGNFARIIPHSSLSSISAEPAALGPVRLFSSTLKRRR
jgi:hypothetical protein